jgi:hypothetical protein
VNNFVNNFAKNVDGPPQMSRARTKRFVPKTQNRPSATIKGKPTFSGKSPFEHEDEHDLREAPKRPANASGLAQAGV